MRVLSKLLYKFKGVSNQLQVVETQISESLILVNCQVINTE